MYDTSHYGFGPSDRRHRQFLDLLELKIIVLSLGNAHVQIILSLASIMA